VYVPFGLGSLTVVSEPARRFAQKNDPLPGMSRYDNVMGSVTCGACGHSVPRDHVYSEAYDVAEVKLTCPYCSAVLKGPAELLFGKACPSCTWTLPGGR
jgi:hypothetical protein